MGSTIDVLVMVGQLILALSILVGVHEGGHLIAAKIFGMRVEQFSIGFPPKIFGIKIRDTEYSIGAIPLGGFVKISGMIDESLDVKAMKEEPKPWEFRSKPAWQRLIVMLGGIIVNVITGITIFICLTYFIGDSYISIDEINKHGVIPGPIGKELGFETGDKIVAINGLEFERFSDIRDPGRLLESNSTYTVERNGDRIDLPIPPDFIERFSKLESDELFLTPITEFTVGQVTKGKPAEKAGLLAGDKIMAIDSIPVKYYHEFRAEVGKHAGSSATIQVKRPIDKSNTDYENVNLPVDILKDSTLGFEALFQLEITEKKYTFLEAIPKGSGRAFSVVWVNIKAFGRMFQGHLSPTKSLRGPLGIMKTFGVTWDWVRFWTLTGLISMILAFMNLLPIPALDGGHVMFLLYEIVSGRKPSDKFLENAQKVGMVLLLALMVFVIFNDIFQEWIL
ncbi:MAG: RIP metalloprotease RseP [Cyclobacteriaceae bacterium]|nr:RIP metalloprotease RseP [Cyclobacteriaceae bacterium]